MVWLPAHNFDFCLVHPHDLRILSVLFHCLTYNLYLFSSNIFRYFFPWLFLATLKTHQTVIFPLFDVFYRYILFFFRLLDFVCWLFLIFHFLYEIFCHILWYFFPHHLFFLMNHLVTAYRQTPYYKGSSTEELLIISMSIFFHHTFKDFTISRRCKGNRISTCLDHFSYCFFCWSTCSNNWEIRTDFS